METQALAALDASSAEFNGDPERTYLTGFSMGGYGTWKLAAQHPERFAALIVICGGILWPPSVVMQPLYARADNPYARTALSVASIPVWVFHGAPTTTYQ
jgi:predicted peptidase